MLRTVYETDGYPVNWPRDPHRWVAGGRTIGAWVSEDEEQLIGHVALTAPDAHRTWRQWQEVLNVEADELAVVRRLFVAPARRRRGVADDLVACATREAIDRGLRLVLDVADENQGAIAFWERRDWRRVGQATLPPGDEGRPLRVLLFVAPPSLQSQRREP